MSGDKRVQRVTEPGVSQGRIVGTTARGSTPGSRGWLLGDWGDSGESLVTPGDPPGLTLAESWRGSGDSRWTLREYGVAPGDS